VFRFILGEPPSETMKNIVARENTTYGDIVELPVEEKYRKLASKTLEMMRWAANNYCFHFLLKVDDDVYLRVLPLLDVLEQRIYSKNLTHMIYEGKFHK